MRTRIVSTLFMPLLAGAMAVPATLAGALASEEVESLIWSLEDSYVEAFEGGREDVILGLLHPDFLGWPGEEEGPTDKSQAAVFLEERYSEPSGLSFEMEKKGLRVAGDVVITHYLVHITGMDTQGKKLSRVVRMTHTWIREGERWKILGGMSCSQ